jgi:RHS repeat-associated protein
LQKKKEMRSEPNIGKFDAPGWVSTPHGRFVYIVDGWHNEFHLRDHLGNTRVVLLEEEGDEYKTLQQNHYYPFGMLIPSLSSSNTLGALKDNRYLYNGKEFNDDFELNWYDYGARFYDAQIARWHSVDPLAEAYISWTPYRYGFNNPILYIDPDGMFETRREAREHRRETGISGRIRKQNDGTYAIHHRGTNGAIRTFNDSEFGATTAFTLEFKDVKYTQKYGEPVRGDGTYETSATAENVGPGLDIQELRGRAGGGRAPWGPGVAVSNTIYRIFELSSFFKNKTPNNRNTRENTRDQTDSSGMPMENDTTRRSGRTTFPDGQFRTYTREAILTEDSLIFRFLIEGDTIPIRSAYPRSN